MPELTIDRIVTLGAPVLCVDTCTILDLMRDPTRESVRAHERRAALDLLTAMEGGLTLIGLMADQVEFEFRENAIPVEEEARQALRNLKSRLGRLDDVAAVYGAVGNSDIAHLDDHVSQARSIVDRWIGVSIRFRPDADVASRAVRRVNQARTPAKKGRDSIKDCVIIETYLDFASQLRAAGLDSPIVFTSSNTRDYATEGGVSLKTDLSSDFAHLNIQFAPNLAAARYQLGFRDQ